ncbi:hypothetical protein U14_05978 [Candidatus Moduliflexus flocculans]|uniref:Uncharacterized protein n=1 Tax=Candidatus Moduliflexus flocculans TaxID=1499966 RepID=A0A081BTF9_9BACT|nr:hypothetical protein U14_05978 [Candidatus Moduliflexus flocculans]
MPLNSRVSEDGRKTDRSADANRLIGFDDFFEFRKSRNVQKMMRVGVHSRLNDGICAACKDEIAFLFQQFQRARQAVGRRDADVVDALRLFLSAEFTAANAAFRDFALAVRLFQVFAQKDLL